MQQEIQNLQFSSELRSIYIHNLQQHHHLSTEGQPFPIVTTNYTLM